MSKYILGDLFKGDFPITQHYGDNPDSYPMFAVPGHEGVDWGCPTGTEVVAPFDGVILRDTFTDKDYGNFTVIWDPTQLCAVWYCHLQDVTTKPGERVSRGEVVGHTNNTGHTTGPHLHVDFVETDASGNRLNTNNGKQGFLNILDPNLVSWSLGSTPNPAIITQPTTQPVITDQTKIPQIDNMEVQAIRSTLMDLNRENEDLKRQLAECRNKPVEAPVVPSTPPESHPITQPSLSDLIADFFRQLWPKKK